MPTLAVRCSLLLAAYLAFTAPLAGAGLSCSTAGNGIAVPPTCSDFIFQRCATPLWSSASYDLVDPGCDLSGGTCEVEARVSVEYPGNRLNSEIPGTTATLTLIGGSPSSCAAAITSDFVEAVVTRTLDCSGPPPSETLQAVSCPNSAGIPGWPCARSSSLSLNQFHSLCPPPPPDPPLAGCADSQGSGAAAPCFGPFEALSLFGAGPGLVLPRSGPRGFELAYQAGGAGFPQMPGSPDHAIALGRGWSHPGAQRILTTGDPTRAWLLGSRATFRSLRDDTLDGDFLVVPEDDPRSVSLTAGGWTVHHPDGSEDHFDSAGRWSAFVDPFGNTAPAIRAGVVLTGVSLPDGRTLAFGYHPSGKLASATETGVDGTTSRVWGYGWSGDDLVRVDRPDGSAWLLVYDDIDLPGFLTRIELEAAGGGATRIVGAWAYASTGLLAAAWRGAEDQTDPAAIETVEVFWPSSTSTEVVDAAGTTTTWNWQLEPTSQKARILSATSPCPACSGGPAESTWAWHDPSHPLSPTSHDGPEGTRTEISWSARFPSTVIEAAGTTLERSTSVSRRVDTPALIEQVDQQPSNVPGCPTPRRRTFTRDSAGAVLTSTVAGCEATGTYSLATTFTYSAEGEIETIDPPGNAASDVTSFTYDPTRGGLVVATRDDPGVGLTVFTHDPYNRRASRTDANGVTTSWVWDALDRLRFEVRAGAIPAEDLVTEWRYDGFGDLEMTIHPRGNATFIGRDVHGREIAREQRGDETPGSVLDRVVWELDPVGRRTRESFQRWDGGGWVEAGAKAFEYGCVLERVIDDPPPHGTAGLVTEIETNCSGQPVSWWDQAHPRAQFPTGAFELDYDALGRLTSRSAPWGADAGAPRLVESFAWSPWDELAQVVDGEGGTTAIARSDRGLLTSLSAPGRGTTTFSWTPHGRLATVTDAAGVVTTRSYDATGRLAGETVSGAPQLARTFAWGTGIVSFDRGRLFEVARGNEALSFEWDRFGRMIGEGPLTWGWDDNGNRASLTHPDGTVVTWGHDGRDREEGVIIDWGLGPVPLAAVQRRSPFGPADYWVWNGYDEVHTLDTRGLPDQIWSAYFSGHPGFFSETWTHDAVGDPIDIAAANDPSRSRTFDWQAHQRLPVTATGPWAGPFGWAWNRIGGLATSSRSGITDSYGWLANGAGGDSPVLSSITHGVGGKSALGSDALGRLTSLNAGANTITLERRPDGTLEVLRRPAGGAAATLAYSLAGMLEQVDAWAPETIFRDGFETATTACWSSTTPSGPAPQACLPGRRFRPTFSLAGELLRIEVTQPDGTANTVYVVPFEGHPRILVRPAVSQTYLSLDPTGRPLGARGSGVWRGVLEPFGRDPLAGTPQSLETAGIPLRHPGHFEDPTWTDAGLGLELQLGATTEWSAILGRQLRPTAVVRDALDVALNEGPEIDLDIDRLIAPYGGLGQIRWPVLPQTRATLSGLTATWVLPFVVDIDLDSTGSTSPLW